MTKPIAILFAGAMLLAGAAQARQAADAATPAQATAATTAAATESATRWLALTDSARWAESWEEMAPAAQAMVTRANWTSTLPSVRDPLGAVKARKLQSATFTNAMPGAPAGDYVLIQYVTEFANKPQSMETVVPMLLPDGRWKVSGYFVR